MGRFRPLGRSGVNHQKQERTRRADVTTAQNNTKVTQLPQQYSDIEEMKQKTVITYVRPGQTRKRKTTRKSRSENGTVGERE